MYKNTLIALLLLALAAGVSTAQDDTVPRYEPMDGCFTEITIELDYECGYVTVPKFYDGRTDGTIRLAVVRIFSTGEGESRSPVFWLDGGPGGSMLTNLGIDQTSIATELERVDDPDAATPVLDMLETRDFVIFSQRGTQFSEPNLICEELDTASRTGYVDNLEAEAVKALARDLLQACVDEFVAAGVDLNAFNNFANADDVNTVRDVLGYEQIVYYGESYGAQLGQFVMQRHPDILEAVILDGVNALSKVEWTEDNGVVLEQAIEVLLDLCAADDACSAAIENPETLLADAFAVVQSAPLNEEVTIDETTVDLEVTEDVFASALEFVFLNPLQLPSIVVALADVVEGDASILATFFVGDAFGDSSGESTFANVMHLAMVCSDDPPQAEPSYDESTYSEFAIAAEQELANFYVNLCGILDVEQLPEESDIDVTLDVPTLVLSGGLDIRTPPFRNQEVADMLPNSRIITFEYGTHVQYRGDNPPCAAALVRDFVVDPATLNDLDDSCTDTVTPPTLQVPPPTIPELFGVEFVTSGLSVVHSDGESEYIVDPNGATYSITFIDDEQLTIVADCNTITATYETDGENTIDIDLGASTLVACPEGSVADEYLAILANAEIIQLGQTGEAVFVGLNAPDGSNVILFVQE